MKFHISAQSIQELSTIIFIDTHTNQDILAVKKMLLQTNNVVLVVILDKITKTHIDKDFFMKSFLVILTFIY